MTALDLGAWFAQAAGGSMLLALPVAVLAGVVSFFSPCVLPLLPGYLSYATGLTASDVTSGTGSRGRMLLGTSLFIAGFALVAAPPQAGPCCGERLLRPGPAIRCVGRCATPPRSCRGR